MSSQIKQWIVFMAYQLHLPQEQSRKIKEQNEKQKNKINEQSEHNLKKSQ